MDVSCCLNRRLLNRNDPLKNSKIYRETVGKDRFLQALASESNGKKAMQRFEIRGGYLYQQWGCLETETKVELFEFEVHPIFAFSNFDEPLGFWTPKRYSQIMPAISLVSKLIQAPHFQSFWIHLLYGKDLAKGSADVAKHFKQLASLITFCLLPGDKFGGESTYTNGLMAPSLWDLEGVLQQDAPTLGPRPAKSPFRAYISLSLRHLYRLLSSNANTRFSRGEYFRLQLTIASVLGHELAHAFWTFRMHPVVTQNGIEAEPYAYPSDPMPELGFAWQVSVFGALLIQDIIVKELDFYGPMFSTTWNHALSFPNIYAVASNTQVQAWFCKETWADLKQALADGRLRMPLVSDRPPLVFMHRYKNGRWWPVLVVNGEETPSSRGLFSPSPPKNIPLSQWYWQMIPDEIERSLSEGTSKPEDFPGPWGPFYSKSLRYGAKA